MFSTLRPLTRDLAAHIRQSPNALMVLGGEHGTAVPELSLRSSVFDIVLQGEGEETFVNLAKALYDWCRRGATSRYRLSRRGHVPDHGGLSRATATSTTFRRRTGIRSRSRNTSRATRSTAPISGRSMPLLSTARLSLSSTFCSSPEHAGPPAMCRGTSAKVADEIELYKNKYNIVNVDFQDLTAVVKRKWVIEFCHELIKRDSQRPPGRCRAARARRCSTRRSPIFSTSPAVGRWPSRRRAARRRSSKRSRSRSTSTR